MNQDPNQTRSYLTFKSTAFNVTEPKPEFLNESNFGDDVAAFIADRLRKAGWEVAEEIGQEDHGWYLTYRKGKPSYDLIVQLVNGETGLWLAWIEKGLGILPSLLGGRKKPVPTEALVAVYDALKEADEVQDLMWFTKEEFIDGRPGAKTPVG